jgi:predicted  nucleic acid-binding Zn-ribbon protein
MKRKPIFDSIDSQYQKQYENLRVRKNGIAVTKLNDNSCEACGANLTASQRQSARSSTQFYICPNCGRILYGAQ